MRGDRFHNYLVQQAATVFRDVGLTVYCEHPLHLPEGRTDYVDLLIARRPAAVEETPTGVKGILPGVVAEVETTPRYVLVNVEKALMLELPLIVIVPDRKLKSTIESKVENAFTEDALRHVYFLLPDELLQVLTQYFPDFSPVNEQWKNRKNRKINCPGHIQGNS